MIAASILKSKGYNSIQNIYGGYGSISKNSNSLITKGWEDTLQLILLFKPTKLPLMELSFLIFNNIERGPGIKFSIKSLSVVFKPQNSSTILRSLNNMENLFPFSLDLILYNLPMASSLSITQPKP